MARQIYRKSLLERMSSPDQLDKMIVITSPSFWMALAGGAVIVFVALIWSIVGRLPIKLEAAGIFVPEQGTYQLAAEAGGIVSSIEVAPGQYVEKDDVLMILTDESIQRELDSLIDRQNKVKAVTLESVGDIATADNRDLISLKSQIATVDLEIEQNKAMLAVYQADLAALKPQVDNAKEEMELAKKEYYKYIVSIADTDIETHYSLEQSNYSQVYSIYSSANSSYMSYTAQYQTAIKNIIRSVKSSSVDDDVKKSAVESLEHVSKKILSPDELNSDVIYALGAAADAAIEQLYQLYQQVDMAKNLLDSAKDELEEADDEFDEARNDYEIYADKRDAVNVEKEQAMARYNEWNNEYNTLYSRLVNLEQNIASLQGQIAAAETASDVKAASYKEQFDATKSALINNLQHEINKYQFNMDKTKIKAAVPGTVTDIKATVGSAVGQGNSVITLRQLSEENLIVCYIPISSGKKVEPGMKVIVCPTTVNKQEYGHMQAEVISVDDYVASSSSIRSMLGDDLLAQSFTQNGPVVGVTCRLRTDESTASGYWWSSKKGAELMVPDGTLVTADFVTEEKAPISMLIPYIKEKLTMAVEPGAGADGGGK